MGGEEKRSNESTSKSLGTEEFAKFRNGDQRVFRAVFDQYFALVTYVVRRMGCAEGAIEDVVQESFVRLYQRRAEIERAEGIKSWLMVTARNLAVDQFRRTRRLSSVEDVSEDKWATPELVSEQVLLREVVERVVQEPGGETFALFYLKGLSVQEIANKNNEAPSTVTTRLTKFRRLIKDFVDGNGGRK